MLGLLAATGQTGHLQVHGPGGEGTVWLRDGAVVGATSRRAPAGPAVEAVGDLLGVRAGDAYFVASDDAPDDDALEVDELLMAAGELRRDWDELVAVCPSLGHQARLTPALASGEVTIDAERWPAVAALGSGASVADLAATFGLGELAALRLVAGLVRLGIVEILAPTGATPAAARVGRPLDLAVSATL